MATSGNSSANPKTMYYDYNPPECAGFNEFDCIFNMIPSPTERFPIETKARQFVVAKSPAKKESSPSPAAKQTSGKIQKSSELDSESECCASFEKLVIKKPTKNEPEIKDVAGKNVLNSKVGKKSAVVFAPLPIDTITTASTSAYSYAQILDDDRMFYVLDWLYRKCEPNFSECEKREKSLSDIPNELLEKVLCHVDWVSLRSVRQVAHRFRAVVDKYSKVYKEVTIRQNGLATELIIDGTLHREGTNDPDAAPFVEHPHIIADNALRAFLHLSGLMKDQRVLIEKLTIDCFNMRGVYQDEFREVAVREILFSLVRIGNDVKKELATGKLSKLRVLSLHILGQYDLISPFMIAFEPGTQELVLHGRIISETRFSPDQKWIEGLQICKFMNSTFLSFDGFEKCRSIHIECRELLQDNVTFMMKIFPFSSTSSKFHIEWQEWAVEEEGEDWDANEACTLSTYENEGRLVTVIKGDSSIDLKVIG